MHNFRQFSVHLAYLGQHRTNHVDTGHEKTCGGCRHSRASQQFRSRLVPEHGQVFHFGDQAQAGGVRWRCYIRGQAKETFTAFSCLTVSEIHPKVHEDVDVDPSTPRHFLQKDLKVNSVGHNSVSEWVVRPSLNRWHRGGHMSFCRTQLQPAGPRCQMSGWLRPVNVT